MKRKIETVSRGVRCPITRERDNLAAIVSQSVLSTAEAEGFELHDHDAIAVAKFIAARAQGNYASVDAITADVKEKLGGETVGVMFPVLSRSRFTICLEGIAKRAKKVVLILSYPNDEVGNKLVSIDRLDETRIDPYSGVLSLETYRKLFGENRHEFIGIDYVSYYGDLIRSCGAEVEIIFANHPKEALRCTKNILTCDVHTRAGTRCIPKANGTERVCGLGDIMTVSVDGSGYNEAFDLLGSNKSTEDMVKLFPRNCQPLVQDIQRQVLQACRKHVEAMVYGDGALKGPVGKIWELVGPYVSPTYTPRLEGTPNELKLRYLTDSDFAQLEEEELQEIIEAETRKGEDNLVGSMASRGTTPRRLIGSIDPLYDLTSGSGDKGTPIVLVQGYFDNFTN